MKQVIQSYKTGEIQMVEVPMPNSRSNFVLVKDAVSLLSIASTGLPTI
jgi:hypothetical protein